MAVFSIFVSEHRLIITKALLLLQLLKSAGVLLVVEVEIAGCPLFNSAGKSGLPL